MIPATTIANRVRERSQINKNSQLLTQNKVQSTTTLNRWRQNENTTSTQFFKKRNSSQLPSQKTSLSGCISKALLKPHQDTEEELLNPCINQYDSLKQSCAEDNNSSLRNKVKLPYIAECMWNDQFDKDEKLLQNHRTKQSNQLFLRSNKSISNNSSVEKLTVQRKISGGLGSQNQIGSNKPQPSTFKQRYAKSKRVNPDVLLEQLVNKQNELKNQNFKFEDSQKSKQNCSLDEISYLAATQTLGCSNSCQQIKLKCQNQSCSRTLSNQITQSTCYDSKNYSKNESYDHCKNDVSELSIKDSILLQMQKQKQNSYQNLYQSERTNILQKDLACLSSSQVISIEKDINFQSFSQNYKNSTRYASPEKNQQISARPQNTFSNNLQIGEKFEPDYLSYHGIQENHRLRMIDWMIQVFRVLGKQVTKTFVQAVQIMDKFFHIKMLQGSKQNKADFHIIGLTSIFIASKYEDVRPIFMRQILNEAAHGKYDQSQILMKEKDILQTLEFKVQEYCFYEQACEKLQGIISKNNNTSQKSSQVNQQDRKHLFVLCGFFSHIALHSSEIAHQDIDQLSSALIYLTLQYCEKQTSSKLKQFINKNIMILQDQTLLNKFKTSQQIYRIFKQGLNVNYTEIQRMQLKKLRNKISLMFINFKEYYPNQQNLIKNYPDLLSQDSISLLSTK